MRSFNSGFLFGPNSGPNLGSNSRPDFGPNSGSDFGPNSGPTLAPNLILFCGSWLCCRSGVSKETMSGTKMVPEAVRNHFAETKMLRSTLQVSNQAPESYSDWSLTRTFPKCIPEVKAEKAWPAVKIIVKASIWHFLAVWKASSQQWVFLKPTSEPNSFLSFWTQLNYPPLTSWW